MPLGAARRRPRGFTLVELVVVLALVGVLVGVGASRFADRRPFEVSAGADQIVSALRTAQATAIAQRREVHVVLQASPATLQVCLDAACSTPLPAPGSDTWLPNAAGLTLDSAPTFSYTAEGAATLGSTLVLRVQGGVATASVRVEAGSGHAHRP